MSDCQIVDTIKEKHTYFDGICYFTITDSKFYNC
ncbi:hypothetical protein BJV85_002775 [Clostridium acetobutylicum]|nr:hypothetical protein [Clostridium acetobutylicum]NOW15428.1 hypothetical protein [Clostridium acetobutylicum]NRY57107.1 hypothetical protein [Clostridium acetobutylicum]NSA93852.1 hypothetical protein [Clostridium acetobutylicum]NYC94984.1 hypothetical protein [Clostridium acetobutylicum]